MNDDNDGQMIFGDLGGLKLPDICLTGEEKPRENLTQEICPDRGSPPGPLRDRRACYLLSHSGGPQFSQIYSLTSSGIFSDLLSSVQMLKREWCAEMNGKLPLLFIPCKTTTLVPEFAV